LRDWKPDPFNKTDFKLTDGLPNAKQFKALTIRKTEELVAYGLAGERAPALQGSSAKHVEATQYHELLKQVIFSGGGVGWGWG
jgi:predicted sulfurtransferase